MRFSPIRTDVIRAYQSGRPDANGQVPERQISGGDGNPCGQCLQMIPMGAEMLVLAHRPFPAPQPYAELGQSSCALTLTNLGAVTLCRRFWNHPRRSCADTVRMTGSCKTRARCFRPIALPLKPKHVFQTHAPLMCMSDRHTTTAFRCTYIGRSGRAPTLPSVKPLAPCCAGRIGFVQCAAAQFAPCPASTISGTFKWTAGCDAPSITALATLIRSAAASFSTSNSSSS